MTPQSRIDRLTFDLQVATLPEADPLQERLSTFATTRLEDVINTAVLQAGAPDLRLDMVELDLGDIPASQLEDVLETRLAEALSLALQQAVLDRTPRWDAKRVSEISDAPSDTANRCDTGSPEAEIVRQLTAIEPADLRDLRHYLLHGTYPHWPGPGAPGLRGLLRRALDRDTAAVSALVAALSTRSEVRSRLRDQTTPAIRTALEHAGLVFQAPGVPAEAPSPDTRQSRERDALGLPAPPIPGTPTDPYAGKPGDAGRVPADPIDPLGFATGQSRVAAGPGSKTGPRGPGRPYDPGAVAFHGTDRRHKPPSRNDKPANPHPLAGPDRPSPTGITSERGRDQSIAALRPDLEAPHGQSSDQGISPSAHLDRGKSLQSDTTSRTHESNTAGPVDETGDAFDQAWGPARARPGMPEPEIAPLDAPRSRQDAADGRNPSEPRMPALPKLPTKNHEPGALAEDTALPPRSPQAPHPENWKRAASLTSVRPGTTPPQSDVDPTEDADAATAARNATDLSTPTETGHLSPPATSVFCDPQASPETATTEGQTDPPHASRDSTSPGSRTEDLAVSDLLSKDLSEGDLRACLADPALRERVLVDATADQLEALHLRLLPRLGGFAVTVLRLAVMAETTSGRAIVAASLAALAGTGDAPRDATGWLMTLRDQTHPRAARDSVFADLRALASPYAAREARVLPLLNCLYELETRPVPSVPAPASPAMGSPRGRDLEAARDLVATFLAPPQACPTTGYTLPLRSHLRAALARAKPHDIEHAVAARTHPLLLERLRSASVQMNGHSTGMASWQSIDIALAVLLDWVDAPPPEDPEVHLRRLVAHLDLTPDDGRAPTESAHLSRQPATTRSRPMRDQGDTPLSDPTHASAGPDPTPTPSGDGMLQSNTQGHGGPARIASEPPLLPSPSSGDTSQPLVETPLDPEPEPGTDSDTGRNGVTPRTSNPASPSPAQSLNGQSHLLRDPEPGADENEPRATYPKTASGTAASPKGAVSDVARVLQQDQTAASRLASADPERADAIPPPPDQNDAPSEAAQHAVALGSPGTSPAGSDGAIPKHPPADQLPDDLPALARDLRRTGIGLDPARLLKVLKEVNAIAPFSASDNSDSFFDILATRLGTTRGELGARIRGDAYPAKAQSTASKPRAVPDAPGTDPAETAKDPVARPPADLSAPDAVIAPIHTGMAGLALVHVHMRTYLERNACLTPSGTLRADRLDHAIHLLGLLASGRADLPEHELSLPKLLCGLPPGAPVGPGAPATQPEQELATSLLSFAASQVPGLVNTTPEALRETFLMRHGIITRDAPGSPRVLRVTKGPFDMLLGGVPWPFSVISLPWMTEALHIEWI